MGHRFYKFNSVGFTLAELLSALAILGVIATFTIPKVLTAQADQKRIAVFKEDIAALNQILYEGTLSQELYRSSSAGNNQDYYFAHLNAVKLCDPADDGCWEHTDEAPCGDIATEGGALLHNGSTVSGFTNWGGGGLYEGQEDIAIDWNGAEGPNVEGEDQLCAYICINAQYAQCPVNGKLYPNGATSQALFEDIFQN